MSNKDLKEAIENAKKQMYEDLNKSLYDNGFDVIKYTLPGTKYESESTICNHDWQNYVGFTEAYQFCKKCDEKKEIPK